MNNDFVYQVQIVQDEIEFNVNTRAEHKLSAGERWTQVHCGSLNECKNIANGFVNAGYQRLPMRLNRKTKSVNTQ